MKTYNEFIQSFYAKYLPNQPRYIRVGQALFNYLVEHKPKLAEDVSGHGDWDCFYNDNNIGHLIIFLQDHWDSK